MSNASSFSSFRDAPRSGLPALGRRALACFLADAGDLESAALRLGTAKKKGDDGISGELDAVVETVKAVPWTALQELKGNSELLKKIEDAEAMLSSLRKALS